MKYAISSIVGVLVLALAGFGLRPQAAANTIPYTDADMVARGAQVYAVECAACHGANLQGQRDWQVRGSDGLMPAPPHNVTGHTWHHPDSVLIALTTRGPAAVIGQGYQSAMPGYGDVLSADDILAVLAYIKSTWPAEVIARHDAMNAAAQ